ncbi:hypothetical protein FPANT_13852 [Fusarium pseudoanthophilum]|uniref:Uncharacterized protein n=1 Tax=Fusarium pseudoanthophilum TaxID=48495 RepID=A0A8H5NKF6_9HYPO|nr:hypothetical protein FPANT_13852 [Fusarium pseudoanthophilum]
MPNIDLVIGTQLNEGVIYKATRDIFKHLYAEMRDRGVVNSMITNHSRTGTLLRQIVNQHGFEAVSHAVWKLLSDRVYESTTIARQRFPDLFEPPTSQKAVKAPTEGEVATNEQTAVNGIDKVIPGETQDIRESQEYPVIVHVPSDSTASDILGPGSSGPFPVRLPFPTEHLLMEKLQRTLELACYQYGVRELQSTLEDREWDCPEAVELNHWAELLGHDGNLQWQGNSKTLKELLRSIAQIRHTTVHRIRTDSTGLQQFLADAEEFVRALGIDIYTEAISKLRLDTQSAITELAQHKQSLQEQLDEAQEEIAKRRAELDQQEEENLRFMERENKRYCALAGGKLQRTLNLIGSFAVAPEMGDAVPNGDRDPVSDDSNLDNAEDFEDCSES